MEITRQNETFNLKETTEVYEMNGGVSRETSGSLNVYFTVNNLEGMLIGDCTYSKYSESDNVHFSVNCSEENREALSTYADTVIDSVLDYFKSNI